MKNGSITQDNRMLAFLLISLFIMNIVDYILTARAMSFGIRELNPLINAIAHTLLFPILKVGLISAFILFIWLARHKINRLRFVIMIGLWVTFVAYVLLTIWHIYGQLYMLS